MGRDIVENRHQGSLFYEQYGGLDDYFDVCE